jgi:hypothetical protein
VAVPSILFGVVHVSAQSGRTPRLPTWEGKDPPLVARKPLVLGLERVGDIERDYSRHGILLVAVATSASNASATAWCCSQPLSAC